jgi:hypothetical protein
MPTARALKNVPKLVHLIPHPAYQSREALNAVVTEQLGSILLGMMTPYEREQQQSESPDPAALRSIQGKLDELILYQIVTFGWALTQCDMVAARFKAWSTEADGPAKIARFCKGWMRSARILQGKEKPPLDDPTVYLFKQETVPQLRQVLKRLRDWNAAGGMKASDADLIQQFDTLIRDDANYSHLGGSNLTLWLTFLRLDPTYLRRAFKSQRPGAMFDDWYTWTIKRKDPKKTRDAISALKPVADAVFIPRLSS